MLERENTETKNVLDKLYERAVKRMKCEIGTRYYSVKEEEVAIMFKRFDNEVRTGGILQWLNTDYCKNDGELLVDLIFTFIKCYEKGRFEHITKIDKYRLGLTDVTVVDEDIRFARAIGRCINDGCLALENAEENAGVCTECGGMGYTINACYDCLGTGEIYDGDTCTECYGTGEMIEHCCTCEGKGTLSTMDCLDKNKLSDIDSRYCALDKDRIYEVIGKIILLALCK